jgi:hypothetical protein
MDIPNQNPRTSITRSLSEEYYSRSPNSRLIIKSMAQATPTSKSKKEYTNMDEYTMASDEKKEFMIMYKMIPESVILAETKKKEKQ